MERGHEQCCPFVPRSQNMQDSPSPFFYHFDVLMMKGCFNASFGVHRFSGFKFKQRSRRSTNRFRSLTSASPMPLTFAISLVFRSLIGFTKFKIRTVSLPDVRSLSKLRKLSKSSKCSPANSPFRRSLWLNFPRHSIIARSIWLLLRPVNRILPV